MPLPPPSDTSTSLVTGASSGIGAEIARCLAARGRNLVLVARRREVLEGLAAELQALHPVRVDVVATDLTDEDARSRLAAAVDGLGLVVDVLVNNAGFTTMGPAYRSGRAAELALVRTDVEAVVDLCAIFVPGMASRRRGAVLNTASTAAFQPLPGQAAYGASKAFVLSYSQAIRAELHPVGVTVTALCPGPVATGFGEAAGLSGEEAAASLPRIMWVSAAEVARVAVDGLDQDRAVVIPGMANKVGAVAGHLAPRGLVTRLVARQHPALRRGA